MTASCLYTGSVMHRRLRPRRHHFRYRSWWMLIDLDELAHVAPRLRLFSRDRFNVVAFHASDHGHDHQPLRTQIEDCLRRIGIEPDGGPIRLLCMPRVLGYAFNPLSIYFCHDRHDALAALVYEVHNTFGERHSYAVAARASGDGTFRQRNDKRFYVSPFLAMDMAYDFRVGQLPDQSLAVAICGSDAEGPVLHAVLRARRRELSDGALLRLLVSHPFVTLKVIVAIHWEALRLWRKRVPLQPRHATAQAPDAKPSKTAHAKPVHARN